MTSMLRTFLPGMSVRTISHARTEPRGTEMTTTHTPMNRECSSGSHRIAEDILLASIYVQ